MAAIHSQQVPSFTSYLCSSSPPLPSLRPSTVHPTLHHHLQPIPHHLSFAALPHSFAPAFLSTAASSQFDLIHCNYPLSASNSLWINSNGHPNERNSSAFVSPAGGTSGGDPRASPFIHPLNHFNQSFSSQSGRRPCFVVSNHRSPFPVAHRPFLVPSIDLP